MSGLGKQTIGNLVEVIFINTTYGWRVKTLDVKGVSPKTRVLIEVRKKDDSSKIKELVMSGVSCKNLRKGIYCKSPHQYFVI